MPVDQGEGDTRLAAQLSGSDLELSKKAEKLNNGEYLPIGHVMGEAVAGLTINAAFNRGVEHGPWKAPDSQVQQLINEDWTRDEALAYLDTREKELRIHDNAYPFGPSHESAVVAKGLNDEAHEIGQRVEARINQEQI